MSIKFLIFNFLLLILILSCKKEKPETTPVDTPTKEENELLDQVQKDVLKYFWDYAESNSKLARERYHTDNPALDQNVVTTGGSGFGLMTLIVGMERGWIDRSEAKTRIATSLEFLKNADRFHGAWSHWINGQTGKVIPFGTIDNGGDIVETSYLCEGLICLREYFKNGTADEIILAQKADSLWKGVDWSWYTKGENALYWHWSPDYEWQINFKIEGFNECMIAYILGASSPTHPIPVAAFHETWARNGNIVTNRMSYGLPIVLAHNGTQGVGPLFWSHYTFIGLDPRGLTDNYANYWTLTQNHAKIIHNYCVANPLGWSEYDSTFWGLTASYTRNASGTLGYTDHRPGNDRGVISPTAALSSYPYTPKESLKMLRYLYEKNLTKYVGVCGPYDAVSPHYNWVTPSYLSIDQGPIAPMIENYRSQLLWNLFMNAPEINAGLQQLGMHSTQYGF